MQVSLPGQICAVLVTTLVLEGWSNRLAPDHSVLGQVGGSSPSLSHIQQLSSTPSSCHRSEHGGTSESMMHVPRMLRRLLRIGCCLHHGSSMGRVSWQVERLVAAEEASKRTLMERARAILRAVVASPTPLHVKVAST